MKRDTPVLGAAALAALAPILVDNYWIGLLTQALLLGGFALALDLLVGFTGMVSLGHAVFFGLAGYGTALSIVRWEVDPWLAAVMGIFLSLVVAALFAPLAVRVSGLSFLTVTLAFGQLFWGLVTRWTNVTGGENGIAGVVRPEWHAVWNLNDPIGYFYFVLACVLVGTLVLTRIARSPLGMSFRAIRESPDRAAALGYNVRARRAVAFLLAAAAGAFYGPLNTFYNYFVGPESLDWTFSATVLLAVVVGGAGSLWGPFLAAGALHITRIYLTGQTERWPLILGLLYVVSVVLLPRGLASLPTMIDRGRDLQRRRTRTGFDSAADNPEGRV
jgi:branched-chain amino acid transport system permease protein